MKGRTKNSPAGEMFDLLVRNAVDFLERSTEEIGSRPKYSIINFFSAVELFFKARLMLEHWSLIISKPEKADLGKFKEGDFQSVTLDEAIGRLKGVVGEETKEEERKSFDAIRKHRNKLVHFFHPQYTASPDEATVRSVVAELCKGWYLLHHLLTVRWHDHFADYEEQIAALERQMNRLKQFLRVKYEALLPEIEREQKRGVVYTKCPSCGFGSAREEALKTPLTHLECRVCGWDTNVLNVPCQECGEENRLDGFSSNCCDECGTAIDIDYLLEKFGPERPAGRRLKDSLGADHIAYCSECEYPEQATVVPYGDDWLCLNCHHVFGTAKNCEWCSEFVAGTYENTYLNGCVMCEGMMGNDPS